MVIPGPTVKQFFFILIGTVLFLATACGPVPPPKDGYTGAPRLLADFATLRSKALSFRIAGVIDSRGDGQRIQGKVYLFGRVPGLLRMELISPFNTPLSVLTVNGSTFALHDLRNGRYLTGPADPCNIAKLINIPLPPGDIMQILVGNSPRIEGTETITWHKKGFYRVLIKNETQLQQLEIGSLKSELPLQKSHLEDESGTVFDITYDRWYPVNGISIPHEIHIKMPRDQVNLKIRYNTNGVELNVGFPEKAFSQSPPRGTLAEEVICHDSYE
jgi:outer membrane lipoprotein-sorting protein